MGAMEEETAAGSSSAGSAHRNAEPSQPNIPPPSSISSTSVECGTNRDSATFVVDNKLIIPDGIPTDHVLTTTDKTIPATTVSAAAMTGTVLNTIDTVGTYVQATMVSDTGKITNTSTDIISATTDTPLVTIGSTSCTIGSVLYPPDTTTGNNEVVTPTPSTAQTTPSIVRTITDIVSPLIDKSLEATTETNDVVPATTGPTSVTDTTLTMKGIAPTTTDAVPTTTCTTPSTTGSLLNTTNNAIVNTEIVTAPTTSPVVKMDIALPLIERTVDATPKTTDVVPVMTNTTATTDTDITMNGITLTTTDAVLTPATLNTDSATTDTTPTAKSIPTAKAGIAPCVTGAPSPTVHKVLVATNLSPPSLSNSNSKINCTTVLQNERTGCSPSLQSSSQRKENVPVTSALSLLTSYGVSDSEDDDDSDNMDTSYDNSKNGGVLVNGTLENGTSHMPSELEGDAEMKAICEFSSLSSDHSNRPLAQQKLSNGVVDDVSRCDTPDLDIIVSGSYRYTVDVGSGTDDSEDDSESSSSECESSSAESQASSSGIVEVQVVSLSEKVVGHKKRRAKRDILLTPGELLIEDLPTIEDLHISVPEEQARPIGTIFSIVEQQVVVEAFPNIPAIDLDSVLFLDHGNRALGQIFDVFGPVQQPFYVVRFNSAEHVRGYKIDPGDLVYFAPSTEHTNFVVIDELMKLKGSDACGLSGNELMPYECQDFSDDEEEARVLRGSKQTKYTSSTNEFQPQKKRGRGQVNIRGRGRGQTQGENSDHNPFRGHGMASRGHHRFGHPTMMRPRFGPRGPPPFPMGPPDCMHGPPMRPPPPFIQGSPRMPQNPGPYEPRPFSPFPNQMEMAGGQEIALIPHEGERYHNGPPPNAGGGWPQPPSFQFGGPPQFTIPRGCFPSPGVASPPDIPGHPHPPPSPTGNSFHHGDSPGPLNEMMHPYPPASPGVEPMRVGERGWFPQHMGEPHILPPPERYPPPLHSMPPPPPAHSMPPPTAYSMPPPFPSHNMPPPTVAPNMPTLPPAPHPPPHQVPFDPTQLPPPLPPASYYG